MKNDQTGEYELVVGNPQLLSAFVVVVLLCAAAFVMGYEVGQNTPRSAKAQADTTAPVVSQPATAPPAQPAETAPAQPAETNPPSGEAEKPVEPPPQPTTQPAREVPAAPAPAPPAPSAAAAPPGSYWQVAAYNKPADAQPIAQTLKDGNMPVVLRQGPDGLIHVLVGPYSDPASLSKARDALVSQFGIHDPIRK
jgi:cell division septation protein DedD